MIFAKIRAFFSLILAAAFFALLAAVEFFRRRGNRWKKRAESSEAQIEYRDAVDESDTEISAEYTDIRIRDDKENLTDANRW